MPGKFEVFEDAVNHRWRWRLRKADGPVVATGQGYASKASAEQGCAKVHPAADGAPMVKVEK